MEFTNSFEVSLAPEKAWPWLMDVESIVPCMPGAELLEKRDDGSFKGKISVRLGPVGLVFICDATFTDIDNERYKAQIVASGSDAKGRGTANAQIAFSLQPSAKGSKILIDTELELSGIVAQYGRGVGIIQNVANQIVSQFSQNLEARIAQLKEHAAQTGQDMFAAPSELSAPSDSVPDATTRAPGSAQANRPAVAQTSTAGNTQSYVEGYKDGFADGHLAGYQAALQVFAVNGKPPSGGIPANGPPPFPKAKPISGFSLLFSSLKSTVAGWFSRQPH
ncbi:SRPBCC family protein [Pusillimonas sp.]|uniref:SRPBCC family protein n=1 Tax=Pusillimonas sp. TaxID=3040095 RepID=UPI0037CA15BA